VANLVLVVHFAFVLFVVLGGLLVLRWPRLAYIHIPAAVWGAWIEFSGRICPLTPLENALRVATPAASSSTTSFRCCTPPVSLAPFRSSLVSS
jgi:hypothetical protein